MNLAIDVLLHGRSAVDAALYTLLPIMVLMMIVMRALDASGALDKIVALLTRVAAQKSGVSSIHHCKSEV